MWYSKNPSEVLQIFGSKKEGLSHSEAISRLEKFGLNKLQDGKQKTIFEIFIAQFGDLMIWVLIAAAIISAFLGEMIDSAIIAFVVILNAILGTIQESKAEAALLALQNMAAPSAKVVRDGAIEKITASELVPGDVVVIEAGDSIPADLRLVETYSLKIEESALTGESVPVEKDAEKIIDEKSSLGDRINLAFMGTHATYGRGLGIVVETGMKTEMGKIAAGLQITTKETTPLQKKLNQISNILSIGVLAIAAVIFVIGLLTGNEPLEMFLTAVSLAVAAIPEGLVAVVTIVLALGMSKMAAKGAIIRRLPAVETLGSTQIICSDKTGTLTQNKMTVKEIFADDENLLVSAMANCNDSKLGKNDVFVGDPTETALLDFVLLKNWTKDALKNRTRVGEIPFDSERKLSTVAIQLNGKTRVFVKGAPDILLTKITNEFKNNEVKTISREKILEIEKVNEDMAKKALRVLAFSYRDEENLDYTKPDEVENNLTFVGLVGMIDPARPEAKDAISLCKKAGIASVMITGDHKITAVSIAKELGILDGEKQAITGLELEAMNDDELFDGVEKIRVYARVAPEHKSRIVKAWQKKGKVVAMTGDGVNDAPALKLADIGVGMGITGTDVSKGASDMVLTDDNFATIVSAVKEGRRIFDNIHKTVRFLLSSNAGEVISILTATIAGWHFLAPVHILWINLVTDTFPALALGAEPAEFDVMDRNPRDQKEPFFDAKSWVRIVIVGTAEATLAIIAYLVGGKGATGTTMAFLTLSLSQLFAAIGFQSERNSIFKIKLKEHPILWLAFLGSALLQLVVVFVPVIREIFGLTSLSFLNWLTIIGLCFAMLIFVELQKFLTKLRDQK